MLREANEVLSAQSSSRIGALSFFLIAIVGAFDFATGYELSFSIFYTVPVGIASWYAGKRLGFLVSIASAASWLAADFGSGHPYSHPTIPFWNASVRLGLFSIITYLLCRLHGALELQKSLAQTDGLTGILNARTFRQRCDAVFDLAARHERPLVLGYLDLDGFKRVNDRLGHSVGDQVLIAVASTLAQRLRASDLAGRLGGDEFAIVLPETDLAGARTFFTALRESLIELAVRNHWPIGFSIGVAVFRSAKANSDEAIRHADGLMYRVKNSGKNNILIEEYASHSDRD
jgi:diguanylate cyclase (GGDEF)-like protein